MKQILAAFALSLFAFPALAAPQDAREWSSQAGTLRDLATHLQAEADAHPMLEAQPAPALTSSLQRWGVISSRLSGEMKGYENAADLVCIFRGMAEETGLQLRTLRAATSGHEQSQALERLIMMLDDAVHVGEAAARVMETEAPIIESDGVTGSCAAEPLQR